LYHCLLDRGLTLQQPSASCWYETYAKEPQKTFALYRIAKAAGLAVFLAVSPITAIPDPWLMGKRRRDTGITMPIYQDVLGRFVPRSIALQIARQILEQAEKGRLEIA
jgi:hypothetical protein